MSAPLLRVTGLTKVYPNGVVALRGVDLTVDEGEFVVVIGRSGSGKSTLLRCLNRLVEPTQGTLEFEGRDVTTCRGAELRRLRRRVGMIFQHFNLVRRATVETNVLTGALESAGLVASLAGFWPRAERERAARTLAEVGLLAQRRRRADSLSGGQQQRVFSSAFRAMFGTSHRKKALSCALLYSQKLNRRTLNGQLFAQ